MSEKPILFSTPMVEAILSGAKTQTRRVVKLKPFDRQPAHDLETTWMWTGDAFGRGDPYACVRMPYQPGDVLWVRETWGATKHYDSLPPSRIPAISSIGFKTDPPSRWCQTGCNGAAGKWRPSIHLPRRFARLFLCVTAVRVERVQEISEDDAIAEGVEAEHRDGRYWGWREPFKDLWDSLNARRGYGWNVNPWVWVIAFEKLEAEQ